MSSGSKITGEGKVTTFKWFDREASSGPLSPRVSYLFKHLNTEKINAIMNRMNRGEITGDEMIKLLEEETNACLEGMEEEGTVRRTEEDEGTEEDEEDGEMGKAVTNSIQSIEDPNSALLS
nr:uncharacterized protein LOC127338663 [Lolium perenne]